MTVKAFCCRFVFQLPSCNKRVSVQPPHFPNSNISSSSETMLDLKIIDDTKWTISDLASVKFCYLIITTKYLSKEGVEIGDKVKKSDAEGVLRPRQSPPRYDVQRRNDLRLVLTKRNSSMVKA